MMPHSRLLAAFACLPLMSACGAHDEPAARPAAAAAAPAATEAGDAAAGSVSLDAGQAQRVGLRTEPARSAQYRPEREGYAQVWSHDPIAQLVAELSAAEAAHSQSEAALERISKLADTPGAYPSDAAENARRQAGTDAAALLLAERKLSALLGDDPPFARQGVELRELASGRAKLVRVTFPIGSGLAQVPRSVRLVPLSAAPSDRGWIASPAWQAPADSTVPGRSIWVVARGSGISEGDRLVAWAPDGPAGQGVLVPDGALVVSDDRYWCFVEISAGRFQRVEIDARHPIAAGFVVTHGLKAGDRLVVKGSALLLARATGAEGGDE